MEGFKQRLVAIRNEENDLKDKLNEMDQDIRSLRQKNNELHGVIHGLQSNEKLLMLKLDKEKSRLKEVEAKLAADEHRHSASEKGVAVLSALEQDPDSREDVVELELNKKREEIRLIGSQYDEVVIHQRHIQEHVTKKDQKAKTLEKVVIDLEAQYSALMEACDRAEKNEPQHEMIDDLETRVQELQRQLELATDAYETSEREVSRLDRLITQHKADLRKQQSANESMKKELDGIFSDLSCAD